MADQFSESDVESLGQKLEALSQTLTAGEQAALIEVLERAIPQEGDVQGFSLRDRPVAHPTSRPVHRHIPTLVQNVFKHRH